MTGKVSGGLFGLLLALSSCVATVAAVESGVTGPVEATGRRATTRPAATTAPVRSGALAGAFSRLLAGMVMEHHRRSGEMPPGSTDVQFVPRMARKYERIAPGLFDAPADVAFDDAANRTAATQALCVLADADRALPAFTRFLYARFTDGELKGAELALALRIFEGHAASVKQASTPAVVLRVDDGKVEYTYRGRRVADAEALAETLAREGDKDRPLKIRAPRDAPFESVVRVFNLARQAGFERIAFAAADDPPAHTAAGRAAGPATRPAASGDGPTHQTGPP